MAEDTSRLFVGGLPWSATSEELTKLFSKAGKVKSATVITDRQTGRSRGFGFVEMETPEENKKAIEKLNGDESLGRKIVVNFARAREEKPGE